MVAVKNHFHAVKNPKAQLRYEITVEQALAAPIVVEPFGLYDCTPQSDGAAAVILAAEEVVDRYTDRPVWVRGVGLGMDRVMHQHKGDMTTFPPTVRAAKAAMTMAGVTPRDIDVAFGLGFAHSEDDFATIQETALATRGLAEMVRLALAKGARAETLMGLSGLGDLVLTCTGPQSRNLSLGIALGQGRKLADILASRRWLIEDRLTYADFRAATIMPFAASTARCSLRHVRRDLAPCFASNH